MRAIITIDLSKIDWDESSEDASRLMDAIGEKLEDYCEAKKPVPQVAISGLGVKRGAATIAIADPGDAAAALKTLFKTLDDTMSNDAPIVTADDAKLVRDARAMAEASCVAAGLI